MSVVLAVSSHGNDISSRGCWWFIALAIAGRRAQFRTYHGRHARSVRLAQCFRNDQHEDESKKVETGMQDKGPNDPAMISGSPFVFDLRTRM